LQTGRRQPQLSTRPDIPNSPYIAAQPIFENKQAIIKNQPATAYSSIALNLKKKQDEEQKQVSKDSSAGVLQLKIANKPKQASVGPLGNSTVM